MSPPGEPGSLLLEMAQVWWRLILPARLELAVESDEVGLSFDEDINIALAAAVFDPSCLVSAAVAAGHRPRPGERVVDDCDLITQNVRIGRIKVDAFLNDSLVILMQRNAAGIEDARPAQIAGFDFERVVFAVVVVIDPFANRIAREG